MARPFLKSLGGKTRLLPQLLERLPEGFERMHYCEPFVGGGAVFFAVADRLEHPAVLRDVNRALVDAYRAVRDDVEVLVESLEGLAAEHAAKPEETYALGREVFNLSVSGATQLSSTERSAIFVYLNKTCFNGVYRENKKGEFNVPLGSYANPTVCDAEGLREANAALRGVGLACGDFSGLEDLLDARDQHFIYMDPPYAPVGEQSFTGYVRQGFDHHDQERLSRLFRNLDASGHKLMLSNSPSAAALYDGYRVEVVRAPRSVNSRGGGRGLVDEIVVRNY